MYIIVRSNKYHMIYMYMYDTMIGISARDFGSLGSRHVGAFLRLGSISYELVS